ncbi:MAG: EAL domain-containing protein [Pseudomonadota bacterium]
MLEDSTLEAGDNKLLSEAIGALADGFVIFDDQDNLVICNQIYRDLYAPYSENWPPGTSLATIARETAMYCIGLESPDEIDAFVKERLASHRSSDKWKEQRLKNGRWIRVTESLLANNWTVGIRTDITHLKQIEEDLQKSEAQFRDYAETAADYFWEIDADFRYSHISGRFEQVIGIAPESVIGLTREELWELAEPGFNKHSSPVPFFDSGEAFDDIETEWPHPTRSKRVLSVSGRPFYNTDGEFQGFRGSCRDITETRALAEQLSFQASHDSLTGLINRGEFEYRIKDLIRKTHAQDAVHALCYLDLDRFKLVNDSCGHAAGDELLRQLGTVLQSLARKHDSVARLGGDEFGILMEHCNLENAERVAESFRDAVENFRFHWKKRVFSIGVSIGLVSITDDCTNLSQILQDADTACYSAKEQGRNRIIIFNPDDEQLTRRRSEVESVNLINRALEENRFKLFYQGIVPIEKNQTGHYFEVLLRMLDEEGNTLAPGNFMPPAEKYNLASNIDRWVVSEVFNWIAQHRSALCDLNLCSINLSGQSIGDEAFLDFIEEELGNKQISAHQICFEITETAAISNFHIANQFIKRLRATGCKFALDDFGSGLSSFAYLKDLPVDLLKIDGSFVQDCDTNPTNLALVRSIHDIGRVMGKQTVAEFVENKSIFNELQKIGVDYAQGYGISKPEPLEYLLG